MDGIESDYLDDDTAREVVEAMAAKRTGKGINKLLEGMVKDYIDFEHRRVAGLNVFAPDSEEQIAEWRQLDSSLANADLGRLRTERIDYGYMNAARLLVAVRLWLSCFEPQDAYIPVGIREHAIAWVGCAPTTRQLSLIRDALKFLKANSERWQDAYQREIPQISQLPVIEKRIQICPT
jgi:hypothetical protein